MRNIIKFFVFMTMTGWLMALISQEKEFVFGAIYVVLIFFCALSALGSFIMVFRKDDDQDGIPK